jgi:enoyl-CoA hydratase
MGAGFLTALMCDFLVAADTAIFGLPEIDAGLNMSVSKLMRGFNQYWARYLAFTAERVNAAELHRMNIVQKVFSAADLAEETRKIAAVLAAKSPSALRAAKWSANQVELLTNDHERKYLAIESRVTIGLLDSENRREAGRAFAEKRAPQFVND